MKKDWYTSKTVWGIGGFAVFSIVNMFYPSELAAVLIIASLGWAGYGLRAALQ